MSRPGPPPGRDRGRTTGSSRRRFPFAPPYLGTAFCDSGSFELEPPADERGCDIRGTARNDTLRGTSADETICGLGGKDRIIGGGGEDELRGNAGNDTLDSRDGVRGNDVLVGGRGTDACRANAGDRKSSCERP